MEADGEGEDGEAAPYRQRNRTADKSANVEEEVIGNMALQEALGSLKPQERQVVDMKVLGGLTFKEIAHLLSLPMGTVTWRYQNAVKKLRRCGYGEI